MHVCMLSCFICVQLVVTLWIVALWAPLSPSKNTGVACHPPPGDHPDPGIKSTSPAL